MLSIGYRLSKENTRKFLYRFQKVMNPTSLISLSQRPNGHRDIYCLLHYDLDTSSSGSSGSIGSSLTLFAVINQKVKISNYHSSQDRWPTSFQDFRPCNKTSLALTPFLLEFDFLNDLNEEVAVIT